MSSLEITDLDVCCFPPCLKMRKGYDYKIVTKKLNRRLGDNYYVAMLESLMRINESGPPTSIPIRGLGGQLGRTKPEAYRRMVKVIKNWLAHNS